LGWFVTKGGATPASPFRSSSPTRPSFAIPFAAVISDSLSLDSLQLAASSALAAELSAYRSARA
jgi:hypothetical protein